MNLPILTALVAVPLVGGIAVLFTGKERPALARQVALLVSLVTLAISILMWAQFDSASADYQMIERHSWLPDFGISYHVGVDGISLLLVVLTTFLTPIALLCSWESVKSRVREFCFFMLALEAAMIGVFVSLDLFLFYVFWDAMLIPMYFLIGIWGYDRRIYASIKFILYTMAGSVLMLIAILWLAYQHQAVTHVPSFDLADLLALHIEPAQQTWLFLAFAVAFAIKVPLFPFHTWLPDAHVEAPTAGSVILAGVLLKMGTYGLLRFAFPLFPQAALAFAPYIAVLAIIGVVYGALVAMVQPDLKKLVAYSSVSHLGIVVLGICALNVNGVQGAVYQMLAHGVSTGGLFLIVGMLSDRRHTRLIAEFGGLKAVAPKLVAAFLLITLASVALPGTNGFVGEFLILIGAFKGQFSPANAPYYTAVAATGVILSAVYMLWMFQRVNYGPQVNPKNRGLRDLSPREWAVIAPICALAIVMGVVPSFFLRPMEPAVRKNVESVVGTQRPGNAQAAPAASPDTSMQDVAIARAK
ncbi:MAG TPA: NADH-quinone oxidoreductase subunit M [Vicinamibacterales bacterium]|nr:NADH-quinone oxidoreductase subunit M [Vicinamibacterales bacterium]